MTISIELVKELRLKTSAGMMDCKKALSECSGDINTAIDWLRKKGLASASKKSGRISAEGLIGVFTEENKGAIIEVNSETDFVARNIAQAGAKDGIDKKGKLLIARAQVMSGAAAHLGAIATIER